MCFRPAMAAKKTVKCPKCGETNPLPLSIDSPVKDIMGNERGKAILENHCAAVLADPRFKMAMSMTLKQIRPMSGGKVTQEMIQVVAQDLAELPKAKCTSCGEAIA